MKPVSRKERRLQAESLLAAIKIKQKLYTTHFKTDDMKKRNYYKNYSNKLNKLKLKTKRNYYYNEFKDSHSNPRKTWSMINSLLHYKSNLNEIVTCFNEHFSNVGTKIANKLESSGAHKVKDYLKSWIPSSAFFWTCYQYWNLEHH